MKLQSDWSNVNSLKLLKRCLSYFKPYKWRIAISIISMSIVAACSAAAAFLVKPALDDIFIKKDKQALMYIPILLIIVFIVKGVFRFLQNYEMNYCGLKVLERLRNELHSRIISLPVNFFDDNQTGMLMSRILNDVTLIRSSLPSIVMLTRQILTMLGLLCVVFYRDPYLASIAILVLPLAIYPFIYFGKKLRKLGRKNQGKISDIASFLQEIFSGIKVVKAFATEKKEQEKFHQENSRLVKIAIKEIKYNELSSPVMELIGALGAGIVVWYGGTLVIEGKSTPGTFFSFMTALIMLYDPIKKLNSANLNIQKALAGAERVFQVLDSKELQIEQSGQITLKPPFQELILKNVTFTYNGCSAPAVDNVSLKIKQGEKVAIVGPSGSGKTTLVHLLPRFYCHQQGEIILNGHPIENYTLSSLRLFMGIVSQENFLFNCSIRENIAYGLTDITEDKIIAAARAAYAHDFIMELPEKYDTIIGERGVKLSGGQKQRITIARALLKNPPLLILDEATSALDTESERIVQKALDNLMRERTSIVIAHRLSTVLSADRIIVMFKGKIVGEGSHAELLQTCPLYKRLYEMQFNEEQS